MIMQGPTAPVPWLSSAEDGKSASGSLLKKDVQCSGQDAGEDA